MRKQMRNLVIYLQDKQQLNLTACLSIIISLLQVFTNVVVLKKKNPLTNYLQATAFSFSCSIPVRLKAKEAIGILPDICNLRSTSNVCVKQACEVSLCITYLQNKLQHNCEPTHLSPLTLTSGYQSFYKKYHDCRAEQQLCSCDHSSMFKTEQSAWLHAFNKTSKIHRFVSTLGIFTVAIFIMNILAYQCHFFFVSLT